jgi:hypothetical protein
MTGKSVAIFFDIKGIDKHKQKNEPAEKEETWRS